MQNIREKLKRKLSMHDKEPNFDEHSDSDVDNETHGHLSREVEKAEQENHPQGKPGSFLNRMISHGNKKTEDQIAEEQRRAASGGAGATNPSGLGATSGNAAAGGGKGDGVIR